MSASNSASAATAAVLPAQPYAFMPVQGEQRHHFNFKELNKATQKYFADVAAKIYVLEEISQEKIVNIMNDTLKAHFFAEAEKKAEKKRKAEPQGPSSYILFFKKQRDSIVATNPTATVIEIGKICGEQWKALTEAQKQPFVDEANRIKADIKAGTYVRPESSPKKRKAADTPAASGAAAKKAAPAAAAPVAVAPAAAAAAASSSNKGKKVAAKK